MEGSTFLCRQPASSPCWALQARGTAERVLILKGTGDAHTGRGLLGRQGGTETRLQPSVRGSWTAPAAPSQKPQKRCPLWSPGRVLLRACQPLHFCPRLCCGPVAPCLPPRFCKSLRHPGISVASQRACRGRSGTGVLWAYLECHLAPMVPTAGIQTPLMGFLSSNSYKKLMR